MLKVLKMLIFMFTLYFIIQLGFVFFGNGHDVTYTLKQDDKEFNIKEIYVQNKKNEQTGYYLEVAYQNMVFPFQIYENLNKSKNIITNIETYEDENYKCILPIFRGNKIIVDIMCQKNNTITYYHNMNLKNEKFENFLTSLSDYNYSEEQFKNNLSGVEAKNYADLYTQNLQKKYYGALTHYTGIYTINNETTDLLNKIIIFDTGDVYNQELSGFVGNNFVIASYNNGTDFSNFIVVNCESNAKIEIMTDYKISYNSYIQGTHGNSLFIMDRENKVQYEINVKEKKVTKNNAENGIVIYEGDDKKIIEYNEKDVYFTNSTQSDYENDRYYQIDKVGAELTGYYYLYRKSDNNKIDIFRMNIQNKDVITYIATANEVRDVKYIDDYIYYIDGDNINFYSDRSGFRTLLTANELKFNKTIKYNIFHK